MASDLLQEMESILDARRESRCVRLEIGSPASPSSRAFLAALCEVHEKDVFDIPGPLDLTAFFAVAGVDGFDELCNDAWPPHTHPDTDPRESMFDVLARRDVLLCQPFDSFDPVLRLIEEAAEDPDVLAIKQVLYRTSRNSPIVSALKKAALKGKSVTAVVELKARFDEARNIEWARELEKAGAQVIYGVKGLKIHAKVCLIVRREASGIRRYVHYGTGNYNEATARLYTDVSYLTSNEDLGADATTFFSAVNGYSQIQKCRKIDMAPVSLRDRLLQLVKAEIQRKRDGQKAHIMAKFNSLADPQMIDAFYEASRAGVKVDLNVRGICCLRPGVPGLSENITVLSIIDRFLEHSRIFSFHHGGEPIVLIGSADCMPRNLDKRIELLVPILDVDARERLIEILRCCLGDEVKGRKILADGSYAPPAQAAGQGRRSSQRVLYDLAGQAVAQARESRLLVFEPHRAPSSGTTSG
jgi:polyphosphate kinase